VFVRALTRSGSDHTLLLIDSGEQAHLENQAHFSFELSWLSEDGFYEMIKKEWDSITVGKDPLQLWQNKIRRLRRFPRGWMKDGSGKYI
jgi:hypothetical protein